MLALVLMLQVQAAQPARAAQGTPVQLGVRVSPETVTVGQHFAATVRVRGPAGSELRFPSRPDTSSRVDTAAAMKRQDVNANGYSEATVTYALAAWDTGSQALGLGDVIVATPAGERMASLLGLKVYVRSVLPADTALRKPKPFRPTIAVRVFNWLPWAIAAAAALLIALLAYAWWRWRRRPRPVLSPAQWAQREFARIESQRMLESGETERYAIAMSDVVRGYLSRVVPTLHPSLTTRELVEAGRAIPAIPADRVGTLLGRADLLKFAAERTSIEQARAMGIEARALVSETDAALAAALAESARAEKAA